MTNGEDYGSWLPDYEVGDELGRGGFGVVLAGRHRHLNRDVAIKRLPPALANDPLVRARFAAEARVLASLSHVHIVPIYDYVERDGVCLLVMEKLPKGSVWTHFSEGGLPLPTACAVVMAACSGLHYAHERGVLHRDVKPENLLYSSDDIVKITDFGIAKVIGGSETLATRAGEIMGTPAYMAPEQAEGGELGRPADVYAAGVMLYELVSGHLPFSEDGGALAIVYRHVYEDPIPLERVAPDVPPALIDVIMRALARSPADRYPTSEAFGVAIGEAVTGALGTGWLAQSETRVADGGRIAATDQTAVAPTRAPGEPVSNGRETRRVRSKSVAPGPPSATGPRNAPGPQSGGLFPPVVDPPHIPAPRPAPSTRVRPKVAAHIGGAGAADLAEHDLVPVREALEVPPPPLAQAAAALVLAIVMMAVAFVGLGSSPLKATMAPGVATIAGKDPSVSASIELDLAKPIDVRINELPTGAGSPKVQIGFLAGTFPLPSSDTVPLDVVPGPNGGTATALVDASATRYVVAGKVRGELRIISDGGSVQSRQFEARSTQPSLLTVPGVLAVAFVLFLVAYAESLLRPMRRGRRRITGIAALMLIGAGFGVAAVLFAWLAGVREPFVPTAIGCMILGAAAGGAAALTAVVIGRRARIRPKQRKEAVAA